MSIPKTDNKFGIRLVIVGVAVLMLVALIAQFFSRTATAKKEAYINDSKKEAEQPRPKVYDDMPQGWSRETFEAEPNASMPPISQPVSAQKQDRDIVVRPSEALDNEDFKAVDFESESKLPADCFPRDRLTTEDLLPKDAANSKWAQVNPAGQGDVKDQNFLNAGFHIGTNTVGQSLRNANYQLRSDPPNPRMQVSPWNQTTIEYDLGRRAFEIGEC